MPAEHQIRGLGPDRDERADAPPDRARCSTRVMNMRQVREYAHPENPRRTRARLRDGATAARTPSCTSPCSRTCRPRARARAACTTSPSARRTREYDAWAERLNALGIPNSGKVDRYWFRSLYFREPNGILFEIATDGPGFAVDEDPATLGEKVVLPPFLEPHRERDRRRTSSRSTEPPAVHPINTVMAQDAPNDFDMVGRARATPPPPTCARP